MAMTTIGFPVSLKTSTQTSNEPEPEPPPNDEQRTLTWLAPSLSLTMATSASLLASAAERPMLRSLLAPPKVPSRSSLHVSGRSISFKSCGAVLQHIAEYPADANSALIFEPACPLPSIPNAKLLSFLATILFAIFCSCCFA